MSVAAVILAAGRSTRMGRNKMLADLDGETLIRRTVRAVLESRARPVFVVTGHEPEKLAEALAGLDVSWLDNPRFAEGLSTSLVTGIGAVPQGASGALICLGDMPLVGAGLIDTLIARFENEPRVGAVVPAHGGQWGNPVIVSRALFPEVATLAGDAGARKLLRGRRDVTVVEVADEAVLIDADTPRALSELQHKMRRLPRTAPGLP
ncbi:MAG: NTP transferase domain-containing protein [Hyphomicrobiales bacterium]